MRRKKLRKNLKMSKMKLRKLTMWKKVCQKEWKNLKLNKKRQGFTKKFLIKWTLKNLWFWNMELMKKNFCVMSLKKKIVKFWKNWKNLKKICLINEKSRKKLAKKMMKLKKILFYKKNREIVILAKLKNLKMSILRFWIKVLI